MLSSAPTERAIATARKLGLDEEIIKPITGEELSALNLEDYTKYIKAYNVLGNLTPAQKEVIVKTLRQGGDYVAMVGNDIDDILAMQQAQISVAMRSADPAVLKQTDIVLMEDSLHVLPRLLFLGQRMVNGAINTFQLYLSQVGAQLLLLFYLLIFKLEEFPYHPTQGGVINAFAIVVPNILIPIWAAGGRLDLIAIRRRMIHFIVPTDYLVEHPGNNCIRPFLTTGFWSAFSTRRIGQAVENNRSAGILRPTGCGLCLSICRVAEDFLLAAAHQILGRWCALARRPAGDRIGDCLHHRIYRGLDFPLAAAAGMAAHYLAALAAGVSHHSRARAGMGSRLTHSVEDNLEIGQ